MKIRTILGLGLLGTAIYGHKRHGGEMTLASFKQSLRDLMSAGKRQLGGARDNTQEVASAALDDVKDKVPGATASAHDTAATPPMGSRRLNPSSFVQPIIGGGGPRRS